MKLLSVVSARPNFVKLAAIHHAIKESGRSDISHVIVHTGQHYDPLFSDVFFEQLSLPVPNHHLDLHNGDREEMIKIVAAAITPILESEKPDWVLLYGDVNGTMGACEAASTLGLKIAHVEAGLRSFDVTMPEEINRLAIDKASILLLCSEESGVKNLKAEGITKGVHLVGNTMIDTLIRMMPLIKLSALPDGIKLPFAVATLHRPSNVDTSEALMRNISFLSEIAASIPVVIPLHHRLKGALEKFDLKDHVSQRIHLIPPLGYVPFLKLISESAFILTDSGGIQEEAVYLQKRCFTLRKNTERPVTLESGSNILIDIEQAEDCHQVLAFAKNPDPPAVTIPPIWDGTVGKRILGHLAA